MGISCRPEGLLRPSKHEEYPALEKGAYAMRKTQHCWHIRTPTFFSLGEKKNIRKVNGYRPLINSNTPVGLVQKASHGEICRSLSSKREFVMIVVNVTDCCTQLSSCCLQTNVKLVTEIRPGTFAYIFQNKTSVWQTDYFVFFKLSFKDPLKACFKTHKK